MTKEQTWAADNVERRRVADLVPYARNARTHSDEQVDQIAASIREWGWTVPVLIDDQGSIIAGHGRVLAAKKLKIDEIPCMIAIGWSKAQQRAYVIADNKLALNAGWDDELLGLELHALDEAGFDLSNLGFDGEELSNLMFDQDDRESKDDDQDDDRDSTGKAVTCPHCGQSFVVKSDR